jgi:hypothetical protein
VLTLECGIRVFPYLHPDPVALRGKKEPCAHPIRKPNPNPDWQDPPVTALLPMAALTQALPSRYFVTLTLAPTPGSVLPQAVRGPLGPCHEGPRLRLMAQCRQAQGSPCPKRLPLSLTPCWLQGFSSAMGLLQTLQDDNAYCRQQLSMKEAGFAAHLAHQKQRGDAASVVQAGLQGRVARQDVGRRRNDYYDDDF